MEDHATEVNLVELSNAMDTAETKDEFLAQIQKIFDLYGIGHGCLQMKNGHSDAAKALWRAVPGEVHDACERLIKLNRHPALSLGANRNFAFDMVEYRHLFEADSDIMALYDAFEANNLHHVYGLPIPTADGGKLVFVLARVEEEISPVELLTLQTICTNAINKVKQFETRPCDSRKVYKLTDYERKILRCTGNGIAKTDIAEELGLSEHTVNIISGSILSKLNAQNLSHAIVMSLICGEFELEEFT